MDSGLLNLIIDSGKNTVFEDIGIVVHHHCQVLDFFLLGLAAGLQFGDGEGVGEQTFFDGLYDFCDDLADFGLDLEPLELFQNTLFIVHGRVIKILIP